MFQILFHPGCCVLVAQRQMSCVSRMIILILLLNHLPVLPLVQSRPSCGMLKLYYCSWIMSIKNVVLALTGTQIILDESVIIVYRLISTL